jgi:hypothetical protein
LFFFVFFSLVVPCLPPLQVKKNVSGSVQSVDLETLVPVPTWITNCGTGFGLAACPSLGLLVTSSGDMLSVFKLPSRMPSKMPSRMIRARAAGAGLALVCNLGGDSSPAPMQFKFREISGYMTFTGTAPSRFLLVTDDGHKAVHVIDVVRKVHVGFVAGPGFIGAPRGVAAKGSLVAVSAWKDARTDGSNWAIYVFQGSGTRWTMLREISGGRGVPFYPSVRGLRFTADGCGLVVADTSNARLSMFRVEDGSYVRHVAINVNGPFDVEECGDGWLVACCGSVSARHTMWLVDGEGKCSPKLGTYHWHGNEWMFPSYPAALALVPGVGLVVRDSGKSWPGCDRLQGGRLLFFWAFL